MLPDTPLEVFAVLPAEVRHHLLERERLTLALDARCEVMNSTASATLPRSAFFTGRQGSMRAPGKMRGNSSAMPDLRLAMM